MNITLFVPDDSAAALVDSYASNYGYRDTDAKGDPNPQTKADFFLQKLIDNFKKVAREYQTATARDAAIAQAEKTVNDIEIKGSIS